MSDIFQSQLFKAYDQYLKSYILGSPFERIKLRGGKKRPGSTAELHDSIRNYCSLEKSADRNGWTIEWESWDGKKLGHQKWPASISITSPEDLLFLTDKSAEFSVFEKTLAFILKEMPALRQWLAISPQLVLEYQEEWPGIFSVVDYLINNELSHYYLRNVPVPVHTKFIEKNKQLIRSLLQFLQPALFVQPEQSFEEVLGIKQKPYLFTLRWLDIEAANEYLHGIEVFGLSVEELRKQPWQPDEIWVVENETALYMLPDIKNGLAIWSRGKALSILKNLPLFSRTKLYYWGDLDEEGFKMLNDFRALYPHTKSRYMDSNCIMHHIQYLDVQPKFYRKDNLDLLTAEESAAFALLVQKNGRLEQEKILLSFVSGGSN